MVEKTTSQNTGSDSKKAIKHSSNSAKSSTKATKTKKPQSAKRQKAVQEIRILAPIIATFFVSGLVAMVGVVVNYVQHDFQLSDTISSFLASAIYIWFVLIAIPTAYIMNNLGHKNTLLRLYGDTHSVLQPDNHGYIALYTGYSQYNNANFAQSFGVGCHPQKTDVEYVNIGTICGANSSNDYTTLGYVGKLVVW